MTDRVFKLAVLKLGCIGAAPLLDLLLDERADRDDIEARAYTSGAKLDPKACAGPTADCIAFGADLVLLVSPNAALPGPSKAREALLAAGITTIAVGDAPSKKAFFKKNEEGKQVKQVIDNLGFMILPSDPMIGARREFLDPSEMALFNADVIKVLAGCGVLRAIQNALDMVIDTMKSGAKAELPRITITAEMALSAAEFANPYAAAKAYAALTIAEAVAGVTTRGCFMEQDPAQYITLVSAGHEMMRSAAQLADAAREIEKDNDTVLRTPHAASGQARRKTGLADKPA
ncbi:MAG: F420-dependent methylenetetrahydromethanopterin dehydrogenase [Gammaproteobacteria bacterium]|nr:F420-dependent methylenetetrahydromethanopterin dehydrogenase [Gammaproteobacteria bacterium]